DAAARAGLDEIPRRRSAELRPKIRERASERTREMRAKVGCGEVVAFESKRYPRRVVAVLGIEERRFHVVRESDRTARADACDETVTQTSHDRSLDAQDAISLDPASSRQRGFDQSAPREWVRVRGRGRVVVGHSWFLRLGQGGWRRARVHRT